MKKILNCIGLDIKNPGLLMKETREIIGFNSEIGNVYFNSGMLILTRQLPVQP